MALHEWLDEIKDQFEFINDEGAFEYVGERTRGSYMRCYQSNNGYFLPIPQVLRRCFFLSSNEKTVLWELMSWFDKDGFRRISLKTLSLYTGLSEKTVSKMLNGLVEKEIIHRKHTSSVDMFMIQKLKENPYILLSEAIHHWIKEIIRECTSIRNSKQEVEHKLLYNYDDTPIAINLARKAVHRLVNNPDLYMRFIRTLKWGRLKEQYDTMTQELFRQLFIYYDEEGRKFQK